MVTPGQLNRRAALFEQLAAMIAAGVPLPKAMEMAGRQRAAGIPQRVIKELTHHLQQGHTFSDAMQIVSGQKKGVDVSLNRPRKEYSLTDFDIALLSAGEESGRLDSTFKMLARYYTARAKIIRDTITSSIITIVTLHVFLIVFPIGYLQSFALGIMNNTYAMCVLFIIEKMVAFGILYGTVWFFAFAVQGNRAEGWRSAVEALFHMVPLLRTSVKYLAVARVAMALDALLGAGVPVIRSWELAAVSSGSPQLKRDVLHWTPSLETGTTPSDMVSQIRYFPDMFSQLYHSGEISGKLDQTLQQLHTYFEDEGIRKLQAFCRVLNFLIYFSVAGFVAYFVIHFWLNYYGNLLNGV